MKEADEPKYRNVEDKERLELRPKNLRRARHDPSDAAGEQRPAPAVDEHHPDLPDELPPDPEADLADAELAADAPDEPLDAEAGIEAEDTSFLYGPESMNAESSADHESPSMDTGADMQDTDMNTENMIDMLALCDTLQCVGVDAVQANRFVANLIRSKYKPSVVEAYGRGNIVRLANEEFRNLNVLGKAAMDLRTLKATGQPWDIPRQLIVQKRAETYRSRSLTGS